MAIETMNYIKSISLLEFLILFGISTVAAGFGRGIYLSQSTCKNDEFMSRLIYDTKISGVNTFIIDYNYPSQCCKTNIDRGKKHDIHFIARVVMFPGGVLPTQIKSLAFLQQRYALIKSAITSDLQTI